MLRKFDSCFVGAECVKWLVANKVAENPIAAEHLGNRLLKAKLLVALNGDTSMFNKSDCSLSVAEFQNKTSSLYRFALPDVKGEQPTVPTEATAVSVSIPAVTIDSAAIAAVSDAKLSPSATPVSAASSTLTPSQLSPTTPSAATSGRVLPDEVIPAKRNAAQSDAAAVVAIPTSTTATLASDVIGPRFTDSSIASSKSFHTLPGYSKKSDDSAMILSQSFHTLPGLKRDDTLASQPRPSISPLPSVNLPVSPAATAPVESPSSYPRSSADTLSTSRGCSPASTISISRPAPPLPLIAQVSAAQVFGFVEPSDFALASINQSVLLVSHLQPAID